jgi:hypothetical protein
MSATAIKTVAVEDMIMSVSADRKNGRVDHAVACFADDFTFHDYGIDLEFKNKERLAEFFKKTHELFPDSCLEVDSVLLGIDHQISEWRLRTTVTRVFDRGLSRQTQVLLRGVTVVRIKAGRITDWSDYYSGLTSQRSALASYFTDWIEL